MKRPMSIHDGTPARKRDIMNAALSCFNKLGFTETSISDILEKAGASTGSLYHHFGSKEQLAGEIYLEGIRDYQEGFIAVLENESDARRGIFGIVEYHLQWVDRNKDLARYLFRMRHLEFMSSKEEEFARLNDDLNGRVAAWFRAQISAGAIRKMVPALYPVILMGACQEFSRQYVNGQIPVPLDAAARELALAAWSALRTGRDGSE